MTCGTLHTIGTYWRNPNQSCSECKEVALPYADPRPVKLPSTLFKASPNFPDSAIQLKRQILDFAHRHLFRTIGSSDIAFIVGGMTVRAKHGLRRVDRNNAAAVILRLNACNLDQRKPRLDAISANMLEPLIQLRTTWQWLH